MKRAPVRGVVRVIFAATRDAVFRARLATTGDRDAAEDAMAEAYARRYSRWSTVGGHPRPIAWVPRTAFNGHRSTAMTPLS